MNKQAISRPSTLLLTCIFMSFSSGFGYCESSIEAKLTPVNAPIEQKSKRPVTTLFKLLLGGGRKKTRSTVGRDFVIGSDGVARNEKIDLIKGTGAKTSENNNHKSVHKLEDGNLNSLPSEFGEATIPTKLVKKPAVRVVKSKRCGPSRYTKDQIKAFVRKSAEKYNVSEGLALGVVKAESGFDRLRNSPAGARGPMQLMPKTAAGLGVKDICNSIANIDGGVRYLRQLLDEFKNPIFALAAYNAGPSRVYKYKGIPPFEETVSYIAEVVNFQMGADLPSKNKIAVDRIKTASTIDINNLRPASVEQQTSKTSQSNIQVISPSSKGKWTGHVLNF